MLFFRPIPAKTREISPEELHKHKEAGAGGDLEKTAMLRQVIFTFPVRTNARNAQDGAAPSPVKERPDDTEKSG
ncbi:hypothetical protein V6582_03335 [Agrobacterium vitis]|uniref:hypothetical protein n=1 Tax=Agrobacterium vitis TaxID=373 RepID=UPI0012E7BEDE|nr:hypothetical protein [Agrobacterium vitis]MVA26419.1 hypothetical protein [Agrobacterium vitis]